MVNIMCVLFGHSFRKAVWANPQYEVWVCEDCGKRIIKQKSFLIKENRKAAKA